MNKKLVYIFVVLVVGLFAVSACEQAVGRRVVNRDADDEEIQGDLQAQQVNLGGNEQGRFHMSLSGCWDNNGRGYDYKMDGDDRTHYDYKCYGKCDDGQEIEYYGDYGNERDNVMREGKSFCKSLGSS